MPIWSAAQKEAIDSVEKNIVVSASAGSGKTAVLTARMVKRIAQDRIPVENLLAMTFTDAAASEMKNRLHAGLDKEKEETTDEELKEYLTQQCAMMGSAKICTIHSFCLDVIKENYFVIGLSPNRIAHIFSEDEMIAIKQRVMKEVFQFMAKDDLEEFKEVAAYFSSRPDDFTALKDTIEKIVNAASNFPDPEPFFNNILMKYRPIQRFSEMDDEIMNYVFLKISIEANQIVNDLNELQNICNYVGADDEACEQVKLKLEKLNMIFEAIQHRDYPECVRIIRNSATSPLKNLKDEDYKRIRKSINDRFQKMVENYFDADELFYDNEHLFNIVEFLVFASKLYIELLEEAKKEAEGLDFSDMEHLAYKILSAQDGLVAKKYQRRFDEILVDEFQDTNEFQNAMIEMISRGNNIFRVGDIKQSIYRFRGAKPQIMADLMKDEENSKTIVLRHNYRSNRSVVEFNNVLFNLLMNVNGLNNEFTEDDFAQIGTPSQDDQGAYPVEFLEIHSMDEKNKDERMKEVSPKARVLANKILDMKNTTEFTHWRDYCVLVRSHAIKDEIRFVFDQMNIPYTTTLKTGFYKAPSIVVLVAWLKLLIDCSDDISCITVLTGVYGYSDEDCALYQLERNRNTFFHAVASKDEKFKNDYELLKKCERKEGFCAALRKMLQINDFYWKQLDNQERANVDLFMSKAIDAEEVSGNLESFLIQIEACLDQPSSTAISASRNDDVVQITTIHQSKGLQYPVVFFWSGSRTVINDEINACMVDEKLGLGLFHVSKPYRFKRATLQRMAISMKNALEEFEENVRLYYVALTRAQKVGIILDKISSDYVESSLSLSTFFNKKGSTDLILSALKYEENILKRTLVPDDYQSQYKAEQKEVVYQELPVYKQKNEAVEYSFETPSSLEERALMPLTFRVFNGTQRGSRMHKAVEKLSSSAWTMDKIKEVCPELRKDEVQQLYELGNNDLFIALNNQEVKKEFSFAIKKEEKIVHGFVDFLAVDEDCFTVVDFKSDRNATEEELIERYSAQLVAYEENLKVLYPNKQSRKMIYSFSLGKFIEF